MSAISYAIGLNSSAFLRGINGAMGGIKNLGGAIGGLAKMALPIGGLIGAGSALAMLKKSSNLAADFESTSVAFRVMIGDAEKAKKVLDDIATLGEQTPFEFPELASAGRMLITFGESTDDVIGTLRRLGDVSAGIQQPIGEIAELYGKARVAGTLFTADFDQFTSRGINAGEILGKVMGYPTEQIRAMASEGKITFPFIEQAFINMTQKGGKFAGMMIEQSKTMNGLTSTLTDGWNKLLRTLGEPLNDWLKPQITGWIDNLDSAGVRLTALITLLRDAQSQGKLGDVISTGLTLAAVNAVNVFAGGIRGAAAFLAEMIPGSFAVGIGLISNSGLDTFFAKVFEAAGQSLKSAVYSAISAIPGLEDYGAIAKTTAEGAATAFRIAGMDLQDAIKSMPGAMKTAMQEFKGVMDESWKAAGSASSAPLLDPKAAQQAFADAAKGVNIAAYAELVTGETKRQETMEKTKTKADELGDALKKLGESAENSAKKTKAGKNIFDTVAAPARELRKIFMKDLRDGAAGAIAVRAGANGLFEPVAGAGAIPNKGRNPFGFNRLREDAEQINNRGRNQFGKNRAEKAPDAKKDPLQDPIQKMTQLLESMDRRLSNLGLAN